jgi:peptidoglycan hydrolase-like protein with peptidoglycan-binding domain
MDHLPSRNRRAMLLSVALAFAATATASAQSGVVLPAGSVVIVRTTTPLQSAAAREGQTFETTVEESVGVDEYTVIPAGSRIRGVVTMARAATRQESGVIEIVFDRLTSSDGASIAIAGKLTSTDSAERRQIKSDPNARVVLVGGRGGIGAAIAGAGSGQGANSILGALGAMLSEGRDVNVPAGTLLAVEIERPVTFQGRGLIRAATGSTIYTAAARVRAAQEALARRNYYRGPINGVLDDATRRAIFEFQVDRRLNSTGNLDGRTAQALGIPLGATGTFLSAERASEVRRGAQALVTRHRSELGASPVARLSATRTYTDGEMQLWFALSAFAANAPIYEQIVRNGGNRDAAVIAGSSLLIAARRVDAAMPDAGASAQLQNAWSNLRQQLTPLAGPQ